MNHMNHLDENDRYFCIDKNYADAYAINLIASPVQLLFSSLLFLSGRLKFWRLKSEFSTSY